MKLTDINLNDKTEVAAAYALLAAILGDAAKFPEIEVEQAPPKPAAGAPAPASALPLPGLTLDAPPVASLPPPPFVTPAGAATGLPSSSGVELDSRGLPWDARIHASTKSKTKVGVWTALRGLNDDAKVARIEAELRALHAAATTTLTGGTHPMVIDPALNVVQSVIPLDVATAAPIALPGVALPTAPDAAAIFGVSVTPLPLPGLPMAAASVSNAVTSLPVSSGVAGSVAPAGPTADPTTFEQLMPRVTAGMIAGVLPPTAMQQVCSTLGVANVLALQTNPACVPLAWAQLKVAYPSLQ